MEPQAAMETETTEAVEDTKFGASPVNKVPANIVKEIELEKPKKGGHKDSTEVSNL